MPKYRTKFLQFKLTQYCTTGLFLLKRRIDLGKVNKILNYKRFFKVNLKNKETKTKLL